MLIDKVRRFSKDHLLFETGDKVVVAVSGGADSLCLLHLLRVLAPEFKLQLLVAHLNHGLRPEAGQEAEMVKKVSTEWDLPFETKTVDVRNYKSEHRLSEEEAARFLRYRFLLQTAKKFGASAVALGHHLDDQAETVLFNMIRGTGVDGLAGILPKCARGPLLLVRPLLCLKRQEIEEYCRKYKLHPVVDSSNFETNYTRNRIRIDLIPYLEKYFNPRVRGALSRLASLAAADRLLLQALATKHFKTLSRVRKKTIIIDRDAFLSLPPALRGRVARIALEKVVFGKQIGWVQAEQLINLAEGVGRARRLTLSGGVRAYRINGKLILTALPFRQNEELQAVILRVPGKTNFSGGCITTRICKPQGLIWPPRASRAYLDYDQLSEGQLFIRSRWPGVRFHPQGASGSKKLKDFLIDQKVSTYRRSLLPLVTMGEEIVWVAGVRIAHPYRITEKTKTVLVMEYEALRHLGGARRDTGSKK